MVEKRNKNVYVTGMGVVSPYGEGVDVLWDGLVSGSNAFKEITLFDTKDFRNSMAGEVSGFSPTKNYSRAVSFFLKALDESLACAKIADLNSVKTAFSLGTNFGGISSCISEMEKLSGNISDVSLDNSLLDEAETALRDENDFSGKVQVLSLSCASGTAAIGIGFDWVRSGKADIVIAGGFDELSLYSYAGLSALRAITKGIIRPFHKDRDGTIFSEGAGLLVLESEESMKKRGVMPLAQIAGMAINNDAFNMTAPEKEGKGIIRVMQMALADAGIDAGSIGYINCHATGTKYNDLVETNAIKQLFGDHAYELVLSANKSNFGHAMGAAGALEAISTILSLKNGIIPPTLLLDEKDPELDLDYCPLNLREIDGLTFVMSNSYGLGGTNASLVLKNFPE